MRPFPCIDLKVKVPASEIRHAGVCQGCGGGNLYILHMIIGVFSCSQTFARESGYMRLSLVRERRLFFGGAHG